MRVIDVHTGGEPTRVVLEGIPCLGKGTLVQKARCFEHDHVKFRNRLLAEPRGHDAMVGALLCEPDDISCTGGLIFFNTTGNLGMCGHATIGVAVALAYLEKIEIGKHRFETPVGIVTVDLHSSNRVSVENVRSYRYRKSVRLNVDGFGEIEGDIAWGGNWFFLTEHIPCPLTADNIDLLTNTATRIRQALTREGITGLNGATIDHIEFTETVTNSSSNSRNFVLCPNGAYDRSPCGTGTSAKIACLADERKLRESQQWIQESIIGSTYRMDYRYCSQGGVIPTITGEAFVYAETTLVDNQQDPFANGIGIM